MTKNCALSLQNCISGLAKNPVSFNKCTKFVSRGIVINIRDFEHAFSI